MYDKFEKLSSSKKTNFYFGDDKNVLTREKSIQLVNNIASQIYLKLNTKTTTQNSIAILLPRNIYYLASIFAIWKLGDYFIPLNMDWPIRHIKKILSICNPSLVLVEKINSEIQYNQLEISDRKSNSQNCQIWSEKRKIQGIAYIIFTSGSTGDQKGVVISKKAYLSYIDWTKRYFEKFNSNKKLLITAELTFDITLGDIAFSLAHDLEIHVSPSSQNIIMHANLINMRQIDTFYSVPSTIGRLFDWIDKRNSDVLKNLVLIKSGGDTFNLELIDLVKKKSPKSAFYNVYGPTEFTINCCAIRVDEIRDYIMQNGSVPIGVPFDHLKAKLLNENDKGVRLFNDEIGELVIAGEQIMDGYFNDEQKTEQVIFDYDGVKYYKTGDLVKKNNNMLSIIGRIDNLIKIKGYRINPTEIENVISKMNSIKEVKIIAVDKSSDAKLITFVASEKNDKKEIFDFCQSQLPAYMIPHDIIFLRNLPTGISGKFDSNELEKIWKEYKYE